MKSFVISILISFMFWGSILVAEDEIVLTIGDGVTWNSVFDAGFRPRHMSSGRFGCLQFNVNFGIRLDEGGEILHMGRGDVEFSLRENHTLVLMRFYGRENRTVGEAEQKTEVFARMFGEHLTKKSVVRRYEATGRVDHSDAVNHAKLGDFSIFYNFGDSYEREKPMLERFLVTLMSDAAKSNRLETKIEPPEGYEHISLAPVLNEPNAVSSRRGEAVVDDRENPKTGDPPEPSEGVEESKQQGIPWWIFLIAVVALVGIAWVTLRARFRSDV